MRFGYTLLLAGALSLGIGIQAQADDFIPQKAGNVTISLPSGWEVLPKGVLKQFSQENGPEILLLAQGPADDFLKLSIIRNPDPGTQEAFLKQMPHKRKNAARSSSANWKASLAQAKLKPHAARSRTTASPPSLPNWPSPLRITARNSSI